MFVQHLQEFYQYISDKAPHEPKDIILDSAKIRILQLIQDFIAFPHCENFSLMRSVPSSTT